MTKAVKQNEMMTSAEVCEYLDISQPTLSRRVADGAIKPLPKPPALKRHRRLLFERAEIERYLRENS